MGLGAEGGGDSTVAAPGAPLHASPPPPPRLPLPTWPPIGLLGTWVLAATVAESLPTLRHRQDPPGQCLRVCAHPGLGQMAVTPVRMCRSAGNLVCTAAPASCGASLYSPVSSASHRVGPFRTLPHSMERRLVLRPPRVPWASHLVACAVTTSQGFLLCISVALPALPHLVSAERCRPGSFIDLVTLGPLSREFVPTGLVLPSLGPHHSPFSLSYATPGAHRREQLRSMTCPSGGLGRPRGRSTALAVAGHLVSHLRRCEGALGPPGLDMGDPALMTAFTWFGVSVF